MDDLVDLERLRTFLEVVRCGSVTGAAERLRLSQPAVSHRLRALERSLGVRLFEPARRGLRLTEYGRRLGIEASDLLSRAAHLRERVAAADADEGRVRTGTLPTVAAHLLDGALSRVLDESPRIELELVFDYVAPLLRALRTGELDLVIAIDDAADEDLERFPLAELPLAAVLPPAVAPRGAVVPSPRLRRWRYLAFGGQRDATFDAIDEFARKERLVDRYTPRIPHIETLRALVAAGCGYAILPAYTAERDAREGRVALRRVEGLERQMPLCLWRPSERVETGAVRRVRTAILESIRRPPDSPTDGAATDRRPARD